MKDRPILYSAPMILAMLADIKTMTRRVMKPQPTHFNPAGAPRRADGLGPSACIACPYGQPGDRLWVRETHFAWGRWETRFSAKKGRDEWHFVDMTLESGKAYSYAADGGQPQPMAGKRNGGVTPKWWKRPAIFMPRAASRISLEITGVRVERLQAISEADARAEGIEKTAHGFWSTYGQLDVDGTFSACMSYHALWQSINGAEGLTSWTANPWVWVVAFRRLT